MDATQQAVMDAVAAIPVFHWCSERCGRTSHDARHPPLLGADFQRLQEARPHLVYTFLTGAISFDVLQFARNCSRGGDATTTPGARTRSTRCTEPLSKVRRFLRAFATAPRSLEEKWKIAFIVMAPLFTEVVTVLKVEVRV
jgi:hypothetical protein